MSSGGLELGQDEPSTQTPLEPWSLRRFRSTDDKPNLGLCLILNKRGGKHVLDWSYLVLEDAVTRVSTENSSKVSGWQAKDGS